MTDVNSHIRSPRFVFVHLFSCNRRNVGAHTHHTPAQGQEDECSHHSGCSLGLAAHGAKRTPPTAHETVTAQLLTAQLLTVQLTQSSVTAQLSQCSSHGAAGHGAIAHGAAAHSAASSHSRAHGAAAHGAAAHGAAHGAAAHGAKLTPHSGCSQLRQLGRRQLRRQQFGQRRRLARRQLCAVSALRRERRLGQHPLVAPSRGTRTGSRASGAGHRRKPAPGAS